MGKLTWSEGVGFKQEPSTSDDLISVWRYAMHAQKTTLERALELARSGNYRQLEEVTRELRAEGYDLNQMFGRKFHAQLGGIMAHAILKG